MYKKLLRELEADHLSGAAELSHKAAGVLSGFALEFKPRNDYRFFKHLVKIGKNLISCQPQITPIFNLVNSILILTETNIKRLTLKDLQELVHHKAVEFVKESKEDLEKLAQFGEKLIRNKMTVMTFSSSSSILRILQKAKKSGKNFSCIVPESRPLMEGRLLARMLAESRIPSLLIIDAAAGFYADEIDLAIVGADTLTEENFVNKIGTKLLAYLAQKHNFPLYVACQKSKFISQARLKKSFFSGSAEEVWGEKFRNLEIQNYYFEQIPLTLCTKIITNEGIFSPRQVKDSIGKLRVHPELITS